MTVVIFAFISIFSKFNLLSSNTFLTHKAGLTDCLRPDFLLSLRFYSHPDLELCLKCCWWFWGFAFGERVCLVKSCYTSVYCFSPHWLTNLFQKFKLFLSIQLLDYYHMHKDKSWSESLNTEKGFKGNGKGKGECWTLLMREVKKDPVCRLRGGFCAGTRETNIHSMYENTWKTLGSNEQKKPAHLEYLHRSCFWVDLLNLFVCIWINCDFSNKAYSLG